MQQLIELKLFDIVQERQQTAIKRIEQKLSPHFLNRLRIYEGIIAGSLPLQCYLNEQWDDSDVDIYINTNNFLLRSVNLKLNILSTNYLAICGNTLSVETISLEKLENILYDFFTPYRKYSIDKLKVKAYVNNSNFEESGNLPDQSVYPRLDGLEYLIKFECNGIKYDIVLISFTPRYFIQGFDFEFNRIYYDGYVLQAFNWSAIHQRNSSNRHFSYTANKYEKYKENIERIRKYMNRGFTITVD